MDKRSIDDDDWLSRPGVTRRELATLEDWNSQRGEILGADQPIGCRWTFTRRWLGTTFDPESSTGGRATERKMADGTHADDSWYCRHFACEVAAEAFALRRAVGIGLWQRHLHDQHVAGIEPGRHLKQRGQAPDHQACAGEHDDRESNLDRNQHASCARSEPTCAAVAGAQHRLEGATSQTDQGREGKEQCRNGRHGDRKQQHATVDDNGHVTSKGQVSKSR